MSKTKHQPDTQTDCLRSFTFELKREIKENLAAWRRLDAAQASGRRGAYENVVFLLKKQAELHSIPLVDLGLVDYEVPAIID